MLQEKIEAHIRTVPDFPKVGISYKDITPIFENAELCKEIVDEFAKQVAGKVDVVCGIESRGFLFGFPLAVALGVPFVLIRKKGKLPPPVLEESYDLEYGSATIEMRAGQIKAGQRVLIHDDVLATGGTAEAAANLIEKKNAKVVIFNFLIELNFLNGKEKLLRFESEIESLIKYE